jgi:hypothetical protein
MAKVYVVTRPGMLFKVFYSIEQSVGKGCPNQTDDVALVQFFLRAVMEDDNKSYQIPAGGPLSIDGICGPQTIQHIRSWQEQENKLADPVNRPPLDGQISPPLSRSFAGTRSHTRYAIISFNLIYAGINGADKHASLFNDPRCPTKLLPAIFWSF